MMQIRQVIDFGMINNAFGCVPTRKRQGMLNLEIDGAMEFTFLQNTDSGIW
jgi:hypothetical protein